MTPDRTLRALNAALLLALWVGAVLAWSSLPERIPTHFDAGGVPDAWSAKSFWSWFTVPLIAVFTVLVMEVSMRVVRSRPHLLNIPQRKQFLELAADDQAPVLRELARVLDALTLLVLLIFGTIQLATYQAAFGQSVRRPMLVVLLLAVIGTPLLTILLLVRTSARITEAHRRARAEGRLRP